MAAIPFSLVGILPAHGLMGAFFTATSMIGFMAGAGIVVRNSIILVDFIELRLREGMPLAEAVVDAGAVRFRPMLLTALAVVVGASVILADPIFQGLAISLMAGEIASLLISRMAVPVLYFMANTRPPAARRRCRSRRDQPALELREQLPHFLVRGLREILVPLTDAEEIVRHDHRHHLVRHHPHRLAGLARNGGRADHNARDTLFPERGDGGKHGRAGGDAVIDQNDDLPGAPPGAARSPRQAVPRAGPVRAARGRRPTR